jgi:cytoskeletal protein RodZ
MTTLAAILLESCWTEIQLNNIKEAESKLSEYKQNREALKYIPVELEG